MRRKRKWARKQDVSETVSHPCRVAVSATQRSRGGPRKARATTWDNFCPLPGYGQVFRSRPFPHQFMRFPQAMIHKSLKVLSQYSSWLSLWLPMYFSRVLEALSFRICSSGIPWAYDQKRQALATGRTQSPQNPRTCKPQHTYKKFDVLRNASSASKLRSTPTTKICPSGVFLIQDPNGLFPLLTPRSLLTEAFLDTTLIDGEACHSKAGSNLINIELFTCFSAVRTLPLCLPLSSIFPQYQTALIIVSHYVSYPYSCYPPASSGE